MHRLVLCAVLLSLGCSDDTTAVVDAAGADVSVEDGPTADATPVADAGADGPITDAAADAAPILDASADAPPIPDAAPPADAPWPDASPITDCPPLAPPSAPDDYSDIEDLHDDALRAALLDRVDDASELSYNGAKAALFGAGGIDVVDGQVECVYSGLLFAYDTLDATGGYNTEHSWPQSEFPAGATGAKSDMHHLFASEPTINSRRGNMDFGDTLCSGATCTWEGYDNQIGPRFGGTETVFEARPVRRGDLARAHFYFAVRWQAEIPAAEEETLRRWNRCDPPDDAERARNLAIDEQQGNLNPFVIRPELVDSISDY
jgi:endonuclease I